MSGFQVHVGTRLNVCVRVCLCVVESVYVCMWGSKDSLAVHKDCVCE